MEYHLGAPTNTTEEVQMTQGNYRRKSGTCQKRTYRTRDLAEEAAAHMMSGEKSLFTGTGSPHHLLV